MRKLTILLFVLAITSFLPNYCGAQIINIIAGECQYYGYSGDGGLATNAKLAAPAEIAVDDSGNIYIADYRNNVIRKVTVYDTITTIVGTHIAGYSGDSGQAINAELNLPTCVILDSLRNMYIADYSNNRIRMVNPSTGIITTIAGNGIGGFSGDSGQAMDAELYQPSGLAFDHSGNLYIADDSNRIRKVNMHNGIISTFAGNGKAGYSGDNGQAMAAELNLPEGLGADNFGNIFVADFGNNCIRKINIGTGIITTVAGNGTRGYAGDYGLATAAQLNRPIDVKTDASGNLYIADDDNHCIRMVNTSTDTITTIAGNGIPGCGSGTFATLIELYYPNGVALDILGNLYIADGQNDVVQEVTGLTAGIEQLKNPKPEITVYPNPGNGQFTLALSPPELVSGTQTIEVYNVLGERVYNATLKQVQGDNQIDLSAQPNGVYLYKMMAESGEILGQGKLVIQK